MEQGTRAKALAAKHLYEAAGHLLAELDTWSLQESGTVFGDLPAIHTFLQGELAKSPDLTLRTIQSAAGPQVLVVFMDGLVDNTLLDQDVIGPILQHSHEPATWDQTTLRTGHVTKAANWEEVWPKLLAGQTLLFVSGQTFAWVVDTVKYPQRSIGRPETEASIRGPQEAFNDVGLTQMNQIRRRLKDPRLTFQVVTMGSLDHHRVVVASMRGVANPSLVETVLQRLRRLRLDSVVNATQIASLIRDHPRSIFPTIRFTEHVEFVVWALVQGKVAVLIDGDPFVLLVPAPLWDFYQTPMDYNSPWYDASFVRFIRMVGFLVTLYFPALYIVFTTTNRNLVSYQLLTTIIGSHVGLPYAPTLEAVIMIFVIEIIREAALRLPKALSTVLGTMGAIVVGTAVVKAGFVSNQIIVIMTVTALSFYSVPAYELVGTWRIINFSLLAVAQLWGLYGVMLLSLAFVVHLAGMVSYGVPYLSPWVPVRWTDLRDTVMRWPLALWKRRPLMLRPSRRLWRYSSTRRPAQPRLRQAQPPKS